MGFQNYRGSFFKHYEILIIMMIFKNTFEIQNIHIIHNSLCQTKTKENFKKRARQLKKAINAGKMTKHMSEVIFYPHQKILRPSEAK